MATEIGTSIYAVPIFQARRGLRNEAKLMTSCVKIDDIIGLRPKQGFWFMLKTNIENKNCEYLRPDTETN